MRYFKQTNIGTSLSCQYGIGQFRTHKCLSCFRRAAAIPPWLRLPYLPGYSCGKRNREVENETAKHLCFGTKPSLSAEPHRRLFSKRVFFQPEAEATASSSEATGHLNSCFVFSNIRDTSRWQTVLSSASNLRNYGNSNISFRLVFFDYC